MCTAAEPTAPSSTGQALAMVRAGLGYLADCDAGSLGTAAQAEALIGLEHAEAQHTAARARILAAFTAQQGYEADGYYGAASWLRAITRVTKGAAAAATGWARRLDAHPVIAAALAQGQLPVSLARLICDWTDKLPEDLRDDGDGILLAAVLGGADQHDLARLAPGDARPRPDRPGPGQRRVRGARAVAGYHVRRCRAAARGPDPGVRGGADAWCWMLWGRRRGRKIPAPRRSAGTMRSKKRAGG